MTWVSMGPVWQMRGFIEGFKLDHLFHWDLGTYDRRDKGEKVQIALDHFNTQLVRYFPYGDERIAKYTIRPENVLFVDDNLSYLGRVDSYVHGVKVLFAHYKMDEGMNDFYRDLEEAHEIDLKKFLKNKNNY